MATVIKYIHYHYRVFFRLLATLVDTANTFPCPVHRVSSPCKAVAVAWAGQRQDAFETVRRRSTTRRQLAMTEVPLCNPARPAANGVVDQCGPQSQEKI
uniref:Putative secreted protein n=1 Tax=Ixodes ricinus TaxID=34613 RepID=A0A6B0U5G4_IXORI